MISSLVIFFVGLSLGISARLLFWPVLNYRVGDCLALKGSENIYKVHKVGKYGLRAIKPMYSGYEEVSIDPNDLKKATRMDCFDVFDKDGDIR